MRKSKKTAFVFPGIGYHVDKPLLYYSKKIAVEHGFEVVNISYGNFPEGVKGNKEKMKVCFEMALSQSEEILREFNVAEDDRVLVLSKSIGTAVAAAYTEKYKIAAHHIYYTPVEESLVFMKQPGIAFHGTDDSWADTNRLLMGCKERNIPLHLIEDGNHSLETGDTKRDLNNLCQIMKLTESYMEQIESGEIK